MIPAIFIYLLSLGCWLGEIVFFSFFTAPVLFSRLPAAEAGKAVSAIFPLYYTFGYGCGFIAFVLACYFSIYRAGRGWWMLAGLLVLLALACSGYAGTIIRPQIAAIREAAHETNPDLQRKARFDTLHRLSVILNGCVLILDLLALASTAAALGGHAQS